MYPVFCRRQSLPKCCKCTTQLLRRRYGNSNDDIKIPPEPTTCCMSGCANCVWIDYAKELSKLLNGNTDKVRKIILDKISDPNLKMFLTVELRSIEIEKSQKT